MKSRRSYLAALKRFLSQRGKPYPSSRPPRPRPPRRPFRWRPRPMAVDIPPLESLMDIDEPYELEVGCPQACGCPCRCGEAMEICPPSPVPSGTLCTLPTGAEGMELCPLSPVPFSFAPPPAAAANLFVKAHLSKKHPNRKVAVPTGRFARRAAADAEKRTAQPEDEEPAAAAVEPLALPVVPSGALASSASGSSVPASSSLPSGDLSEGPFLRKIAMPTGRYAFRSPAFAGPSPSRGRCRSPSPPSAARSRLRVRSPSPFCRCVRRRRSPLMGVCDKAAGSASPSAPFVSVSSPAGSAPSVPFVRPRLVRSGWGRAANDLASTPLPSAALPAPSALSTSSAGSAPFAPSSVSVASATMGTAGQYRCLASPPSRDSTSPKASRDGTMSPLEYEAQLSPVGGPVAVLPDDIEDVSSPLYYLNRNGK